MWNFGRLIAIFLIVAILAGQDAYGGSIRTVATFGQSIGGTPVIDDVGRTAFVLSAFRIDARSDTPILPLRTVSAPELATPGLYYERQSGNPELVAHPNQQAAGAPTGVTYGRIFALQLSPHGHIAFRAQSFPGVFAIDPGGTSRLVFRHGQVLVAPEPESLPSSYVLPLAASITLDDDGYVTIPVYPGTSEVSATRILREGPAGISILSNTLPLKTTTRATQSQPSIPTTLNAIARNIRWTSTGANGTTVFTATLQPPAGHNTNFAFTEGIIKANPAGQLEPVALQRQEFTEGKFSSFGHTVINGLGDIAFYSNWTAATNRRGIVREEQGELEVAVQVGDIVPYLGPDITIANFQEIIHLNDRGDLAFGTMLNGPGVTSANASALYLQNPVSGLTQLVRQGDHPPGTETGTRFGISASSDLVLNNAGQAAFYSPIYSSGRNNDAGIWATDREENLHLIARVGDVLDVSGESEPADLRTIANLSFNAGNFNGAASGSGFNDRGEIAFAAQFTDGTRGIFVSNAVAVPEPATIAILLLGIAVVIGLREPSHRT